MENFFFAAEGNQLQVSLGGFSAKKVENFVPGLGESHLKSVVLPRQYIKITRLSAAPDEYAGD